jgi:hypothetical protein
MEDRIWKPGCRDYFSFPSSHSLLSDDVEVLSLLQILWNHEFRIKTKLASIHDSIIINWGVILL